MKKSKSVQSKKGNKSLASSGKDVNDSLAQLAKATKKLLGNKITNYPINTYSEFRNLFEVILHMPGREVTCLNRYADVDLNVAKLQSEYKQLLDLLQKRKVKINFLQDLLVEALECMNEDEVDAFIQQYVDGAHLLDDNARLMCLNYFRSFDSKKSLVNAIINGIKNNDVPKLNSTKFSSLQIRNQYLINPLSQTIYSRKWLLPVGSGYLNFAINDPARVHYRAIYGLITQFHPRFKNFNCYYTQHEGCQLLGNDFLVLNNEILLASIKDQKEAACIENLAQQIFADADNTIKRVIVLVLDDSNDSHLTQNLMMIDHDKFVMKKSLLDVQDFFELLPVFNKDGNQVNKVSYKRLNFSLPELIDAILPKRPKFAICAGAKAPYEDREFHNFAVNVLPLAPGEVIAFDINEKTNAILKQLNVNVHEIASNELSKIPGGINDMITSFSRYK